MVNFRNHINAEWSIIKNAVIFNPSIIAEWRYVIKTIDSLNFSSIWFIMFYLAYEWSLLPQIQHKIQMPIPDNFYLNTTENLNKYNNLSQNEQYSKVSYF